MKLLFCRYHSDAKSWNFSTKNQFWNLSTFGADNCKIISLTSPISTQLAIFFFQCNAALRSFNTPRQSLNSSLSCHISLRLIGLLAVGWVLNCLKHFRLRSTCPLVRFNQSLTKQNSEHFKNIERVPETKTDFRIFKPVRVMIITCEKLKIITFSCFSCQPFYDINKKSLIYLTGLGWGFRTVTVRFGDFVKKCGF